MQASSTHAVQATPNVTPMIDVMLVLLVIFMVVAPALLSAIPAVPPNATVSSNRPEQSGDEVLGIDAAGHFYLDKRPIAHDHLSAALASIFAARADRVLYLRADKNVGYSVVIDAIDIAGRNGVAVVGLITEQQPERAQDASVSPVPGPSQ